MAAHPTNPPLIKRDNESQPTMGETQVINGRLMCMYRGQWRPAVRQHTIRAQLIRETDALGSYRYGRKQEGTTDVTAYLHKDRNLGEAWRDRPQIIFELYAPATPRNVKPTGVLMDEDQIMLDPYDHPIRDFPGELPVILSSKIDGLWVEYYLRQNAEIKAYDLMARMPLVKRKGGTLPVRIGTLTERATKFRHRTGAISWHEKDGSKGIRNYVLSLLLPGARDMRSLNGDLTKNQQAELKAVNQGTKPERRHKSKRQAEASADASIAQVISGKSIVGQSSSLQPYVPSGSQETLEPDNSPVDSQFLEPACNASTSNNKLHTTPDAALSRPMLSRKRTRESGSDDLSGAERNKPPFKRVRVDGRGSIIGEALRSTETRPLKRGFDDIASHESNPGSDPPVPPSKRSKHGLENPGFEAYDRLHNSSASQRTTSDAKRVHQTIPKKHTPKPVTSMPVLTEVDQEVEGDSNLGYLSAYLHNHNAGDQGFLPESSSAPQHSFLAYQQAHASMQPTTGGAYCGPSFAGLEDETQKLDHSTAPQTASLIQDDRYTAPVHLDYSDISYSTAMIETPSERSERSLLRPDIEPLPHTFQIEEHQALERGDHRYLNPCSTAEAAIISEAIQLTRYDMILQLGEDLPQSLGNEDHHNESYMAQWHRLQHECVRCWKGPGPAPTLYGCAEIWTEFGSWLITDERGLQLLEWSAIAGAL